MELPPGISSQTEFHPRPVLHAVRSFALVALPQAKRPAFDVAGKIRNRDRDFRATIVKTDHVIPGMVGAADCTPCEDTSAPQAVPSVRGRKAKQHGSPRLTYHPFDMALAMWQAARPERCYRGPGSSRNGKFNQL
uniref:Uncharacterized protein n=1 Tax=Anopheles merus TaxID=30066 RepID=A0A182V144_ANOME